VQAPSERLIRGTIEAQSETGMLPGSTYATATEIQTNIRITSARIGRPVELEVGPRLAGELGRGVEGAE